jgi:hypothetical protein
VTQKEAEIENWERILACITLCMKEINLFLFSMRLLSDCSSYIEYSMQTLCFVLCESSLISNRILSWSKVPGLGLMEPFSCLLIRSGILTDIEFNTIHLVIGQEKS